MAKTTHPPTPTALTPIRTREGRGVAVDLGAALLLASGPMWAMHEPALNALMLDGRFGSLSASGRSLFEADAGEMPNPCEPTLHGKVAVIDVTGPITPGAAMLRSFGMAAVSLDDIARGLQEAGEDPMADSVMLRINSPGGSIAGISDFMGLLEAVKRVKPVVAAMGGSAASLAAWIAGGCTAAHASPETIGGSIGVFAVVGDSTEMFKEMGVKRMVIGSGPYKGSGIAGVPVTEEQVNEIQRSVDAINELFIEGIAEGRGMSTEQVRALATGATIIGKDLVTDGLADSVATPRVVLEAMSAE
ncbi:MAG TPA: S49 family peptidase [Pseudomonadota bacterium]|nr:S49 family peptidase [Pseudomonadota bacterium]